MGFFCAMTLRHCVNVYLIVGGSLSIIFAVICGIYCVDFAADNTRTFFESLPCNEKERICTLHRYNQDNIRICCNKTNEFFTLRNQLKLLFITFPLPIDYFRFYALLLWGLLALWLYLFISFPFFSRVYHRLIHDVASWFPTSEAAVTQWIGRRYPPAMITLMWCLKQRKDIPALSTEMLVEIKKYL
jgi:hypothetical protein